MNFDSRQALNDLLANGDLEQLLAAERLKTASVPEKIDAVLQDAERVSSQIKQAIADRQALRQQKVAAVQHMIHVGRRLSAAGILTAV